jgi:hypothetical protein
VGFVSRLVCRRGRRPRPEFTLGADLRWERGMSGRLHRLAIFVGVVVALSFIWPGLRISVQAAELRSTESATLRRSPTAPGDAWCKPDTILVTLTAGATVQPLIARYGGTWTLIVPPSSFSLVVDRSALLPTLRALRAESTVSSAELDAYASTPEGIVRVPGTVPCL